MVRVIKKDKHTSLLVTFSHCWFAICDSTMAVLQRSSLVILVILLVSQHCVAFQNLLPKQWSLPLKFGGGNAKKETRQLEDKLLQVIQSEGSRLANSEEIASLVTQLELSGQSIREPAIAPEVYGTWRLLYTTNAETSSPIQRKAVDSQAFPIYQNIFVNDKNQLVVSQVVKFFDNAKLSVDALASTAAYPLPELTDRTSDGKLLGVNVLGVSLVGDDAKEDTNRPNARINFVFDEGNFDFRKIRVPYPVPFRLPFLRDAVKGWIDLTFLSDRIRISRGNKGTTFVLVKEEEDFSL
jgi:hypothetical protein